MEQKLTGVPETLLIPLWARAVESAKPQPIFRDPKAVEMVSSIDYDFGKFEKTWMSQLGVAIRSMLLDRAVSHFVQQNPNAVVVNIGAGLDTRCERFKDNVSCWYDLDLPEAIALRSQFLGEGENNRAIKGSAFDLNWLGQVDYQGKPLLLIAEGVLMYFDEQKVRKLFTELCSKLPEFDMLFEALAPIAVGKSKHHDTVKKIENAPEFKWGLKESRSLESWDRKIHFLEEWNYFDYHKDRWKWMGVIARLPFLRKQFASRIVHLRFGR